MIPNIHFQSMLAQATAQQPSIIEALLGMAPLFVMIMAVFYFLYQRPMQKEQDSYQKMLKSLLKGDPVVTIGGIHGPQDTFSTSGLSAQWTKKPLFFRMATECIHQMP